MSTLFSTGGGFALIEALLAGHQSAMMVVGGPGAGKSEALTSAAAYAVRSGLPVARIEAGSVRGLGQALRNAADEIGDSAGLILIDDLHTASPDDLVALRELCGSVHRQPHRVVAALRPWPDAASLESASLAQRGNATLIQLRPLTHDDALHVLVARMGVTPSPPAAQAALGLCAGNPRLLVTVAESLASQPNAGYCEDDIVELVSRRTVHIAETLGLGGSMRSCVEAASVLGLRFRSAIVLAVAGMDESEGHQAVDGLCKLGIFRQGPGKALEFVHPLLQRVLYAQLTPAARSLLHARAYAALAGRGFERRAAEHAILADLPGDDAAIALLARVGRAELRDGATAEAARKFRAAIDLANDHATPALRLALAEALIRGGQPLGGVRILEHLIGEVGSDSASRVAALHALADSLAAAGDLQTPLLHLQLAAELARADDPASAAGCLLDAALLEIRLGDIPGARALVERSRRHELPAHSLVAEQAGLVEALMDAAGGDAEAMALVEGRGLELIYRSLSDPSSYGRLASMASIAAAIVTNAGRVDAGAFFIPALIHALRPHLGSGAVSGLVACQAEALLEAGSVAGATDLAAAAVEGASAAPGLRPLALAVQARVLFHAGRLDECAAVSAELEQASASAGAGSAHALWVQSIQASLAMVGGRTDEAAAGFARLAALADGEWLLLPGLGDWQLFGVATLVRTGNVAVAGAILSSAASAATAAPQCEVVACAGRALLRESAGEFDEASGFFEEAARLAGELPRTLLRAHVVWLQAAFLRRRGKDLQARRMSAQALDLAQTSGAVTLSRLIEAELATTAGRRGRTGATRGALTPREAHVVELARQGRTNKEIAGQLWITVNTVETHLQRAFAKLGVSSRAELRAAVVAETAAG